jgi:hypothetical protein
MCINVKFLKELPKEVRGYKVVFELIDGTLVSPFTDMIYKKGKIPVVRSHNHVFPSRLASSGKVCVNWNDNMVGRTMIFVRYREALAYYALLKSCAVFELIDGTKDFNIKIVVMKGKGTKNLPLCVGSDDSLTHNNFYKYSCYMISEITDIEEL